MIPIFTARYTNASVWSPETITYTELLNRIRHPGESKDGVGCVVIGAQFQGRRRVTRELIGRTWVSLDADQRAQHIPREAADLGVQTVIYTTYSSTPDALRLRVLAPLSRAVSPAEYELVCEWVGLHLGERESWDVTSFRPVAYMYWPAAEHAEWHQVWEHPGRAIDVDAAIAEVTRVVEEDPRALVRQHRVSAHKRRQDPRELPGAVGAFNRVYDLELLIETYGVPYERVGADGRYRYVGSRSSPGMGEIIGAPGLYQSHHANDPAVGQALTAFDVLRVHRFGDLDLECKPSTPINRLPSYVACLALINEDYRVKIELNPSSDFDLDPSLTEAIEDWVLDLDRNARNGKALPSAKNIKLVLENDPVLGCLCYDMLRNQVAIKHRTGLPWDKQPREGDYLLDTDAIYFRDYLELKYGMDLPEARALRMLWQAAQEKRYNPLQDYLSGLSWDGVPRVAECLPVLAQTDFTRTVAKRVLVGAVARALDPGCQVDLSLILYGEEGIGKTSWIRRMVGAAYLGELKDITNKDTLLEMRQKWVLVSDEVEAMRRAQFDALKAFLTRTHDTFRAPFGRETIQYKRRSVFWGTTNDPKFLVRQAGNRRFVIVECGAVDFSAMSQTYVDQVWAEAVELWRSGEPYHFSAEEESQAAQAREQFTSADTMHGIVSAYLEMRVPADWATRGPEARRAWWTVERHLMLEAATQPLLEATALGIWTEALDGRGIPREADIRRIEAALHAASDWASTGTRGGVYGAQETFIPRPPWL